MNSDMLKLLRMLRYYREDQEWWSLANYEENASLIDFTDWLEEQVDE